MKKHIALILTVLFFAFAATAQDKEAKQIDSAPKTETVLRVETDGGKPFELKAADFTKLARRQVKGKTHDGAEATYAGVELREVLKLAGVKFGKEAKGSHLNSFLVVEAADNYRVVFAMSELEADLTDKVILLADTRDGKPLSKEEGNLRLVVPDEKKQARWVRQVIKLTIKTINSRISSNTELNKSDDEDAIRETVFTDILKSWVSTQDRNLKAFYLSVDDAKDPSDNLLKKITGYRVPIKKSSESFISEADGSVVLDVNTKERGVLFSISKIDWKNKDEVKVSAGSYIGNMGSDGCIYVLKRENEKWKIVSREECFIS